MARECLSRLQRRILAWLVAEDRRLRGTMAASHREVVNKAKSLTRTLTVLLLLGSGVALAGSVRCTTYEEKTLNRLQTLCDDGTRAVSTYNRTLSRWESTVTPPLSSIRSKIAPKPKASRR
jgi:hypothetical protein